MTKGKYISIAIMFVIAILIGSLPPAGQITEVGMKVLGVFVAILYGWIFVDLLLPSIFGFIGLGLTGYTTINGALSSGFGNTQLLMVLVVMAFAGAIEESKLTGFLANWFLAKDFFNKNPWRLITGLVLIAFLLGMLGGGIAAIFILWAIISSIFDDCGMPKQNNVATFLIATTCYAVTCGTNVIPFQTGSIIYGGFLTQATGVTIPFAQFIVYGLLAMGIPLILMLLFSRYILKVDASQFIMPERFKEELQNKKSTKSQRIALVLLLIYAVCLVLPGLFPSLPGMTLLSNLGIVGISLIALLVMALLKIEGSPLINLTKVFDQHMNWTLLLLLAVTFPLADALKDEQCGIMLTVDQAITPIVENMGLTTFMILSTLILGLITQVTHNIVLGAMFIPFLCPLFEQLGGNMIVMWFMIFAILNCAYATPAGSMQSAMIFGNDRIIRKQAYIYGFAFLLVTLIVLIALIPVGNMLFS